MYGATIPPTLANVEHAETPTFLMTVGYCSAENIVTAMNEDVTDILPIIANTTTTHCISDNIIRQNQWYKEPSESDFHLYISVFTGYFCHYLLLYHDWSMFLMNLKLLLRYTLDISPHNGNDGRELLESGDIRSAPITLPCHVTRAVKSDVRWWSDLHMLRKR